MARSLEALGVDVAAALARALPPASAAWLGRALGRTALALGVRRRVAEENLERALGSELSVEARRRIARGAYEHLGTSLLEFLALPHLDAAAVRARVHLVGVENVRDALAGGGAVVASGHIGNWELTGAGCAAHGLPVTFVVQALGDQAVEARVHAIRRGAGIEVLTLGMGLRRLRASLARNRLAFFMCDQDARRRGIFVPFFGVPASTPQLAARVALRLGVPFVPAFGHRSSAGRHVGIFEPPLAHEGHGEAAVRSLLAGFNARLEAHVRRVPEQYWWAHRRWKTRVPDARPTPAPGATAQVR